MKILHVIPGLTHQRGGPSAVLAALCRHQLGAGHQVTVLTTDQGSNVGEKPVALDEGVIVERPEVAGPNRLAYAPGLAPAAKRLVKLHDLVHVHSLFTYPVHVALRAALAAGTPVILRPCGHLHRYSLRRSSLRKRIYLRWWGGLVRRSCTAWHYTSKEEASHSWPEDDSPRFILPNGIEPSAFQMNPGEARAAVDRAWTQLGGSPYVLFLGRLHPKKRLDLLLEAFLTGGHSAVKLVIAGPDECELWPSLAGRFLGNTAARERVVRLGMVEGRAKVTLLAGANLFALPSEHENFGVAALEALAAGTPVLVSPHVDFAGVAAADGLVHVAPLVLDVWREKLEKLLISNGDVSHREQACRQIAERFAWGRITKELENRYRWVLAGCPIDTVCPGPELSGEGAGV